MERHFSHYYQMKKLLITLLLLPILAFAWTPTKPITVIIGNQPGSGNEVGFRAISAIVNKTNPAVFVIDLKPGADSVVAMNILYDAKPDGYTIAIPSYMSTYVTNDIWQKDIKHFRYNSFTTAFGMGKSPLAIVANPKSKIHTPAELSQLVKTTDKPITFALGGGAHRMAYEFFMYKSNGNKDKVKFTQFPGPAQALNAVASDAGMEFGIMPVSIALPLIQSGHVKLIGITGEKKLPQLPLAEPIKVGGSYINVFAAWALALPPNTPSDIVEWYAKEFIPALRSAEIKQYYESNLIFIENKELTPAGFNKNIESIRSIFIPLSEQVNLLSE
jgi:tripartite-type tricarboxylate transporter receptor subunit TctC